MTRAESRISVEKSWETCREGAGSLTLHDTNVGLWSYAARPSIVVQATVTDPVSPHVRAGSAARTRDLRRESGSRFPARAADARAGQRARSLPPSHRAARGWRDRAPAPPSADSAHVPSW